MENVLEKILDEINSHLKKSLPWLDSTYGKSERLAKSVGGIIKHIPGIYVGNQGSALKNEYLDMFPDSQKGNFSFFWFPDPQEVGGYPRSHNQIKAPFSLIFWFDLRKVFESDINRNKEGLKLEILHALGRSLFLTQGRVQIDKVYELSENIYREFSISEVENQFLMHPYAGFRFEGILYYTQPCL